MGRWLKKLESMSTTEPTKLTQHTSVGFVSTSAGHLHKNITEKGLIDVVKKCCGGLQVDAQQVIDGLLSSDDEQDIINGNTPVESLRLHIELWIKAGKPHYSGKELG
jgi:hypothetical protein